MSRSAFGRIVVVARRVAVTLAALVTVAGLGSTVALALANRAGWQVLGMKTGSMSPAIDPGDLVVVQPVSPADIRNGDVITFRAPVGSHAPYTHRVVEIRYGVGGPEFVTKGDANASADVWTVHYVAEALRMVHVVPQAGRALAFQQSTAGRRLVAGAVFVLTVALMWPVFRAQPRPHLREVPA